MTLPSKAYEVIKWMVVIFLPALSVAILALKDPFPAFTYATQISQCIAIVQTFLGSIFLISSANYYASTTATSGYVSITEAANTDTSSEETASDSE